MYIGPVSLKWGADCRWTRVHMAVRRWNRPCQVSTSPRYWNEIARRGVLRLAGRKRGWADQPASPFSSPVRGWQLMYS